MARHHFHDARIHLEQCGVCLDDEAPEFGVGALSVGWSAEADIDADSMHRIVYSLCRPNASVRVEQRVYWLWTKMITFDAILSGARANVGDGRANVTCTAVSEMTVRYHFTPRNAINDALRWLHVSAKQSE